MNTENGGFTPDKCRGPKGPDLKHDQGDFVKEISRDRIYLFSRDLQDYIYIYIVPGTIYIIPHIYVQAPNQYSIRYSRKDYIQKPPPDFKTLYCS